MTIQSKNGGWDQVEEVVGPAERRDHRAAATRGQHLADIADSIIGELHATGTVPRQQELKKAIVHVLADALYPNRAIDMPSWGVSF